MIRGVDHLTGPRCTHDIRAAAALSSPVSSRRRDDGHGTRAHGPGYDDFVDAFATSALTSNGSRISSDPSNWWSRPARVRAPLSRVS